MRISRGITSYKTNETTEAHGSGSASLDSDPTMSMWLARTKAIALRAGKLKGN